MLIENVMYFALGTLVSALLALIVLPAVWRRAVRLTKRRIEAATPMTMAEFRADKDQLRAQFALSTRRLEMQVEQLRARLAEELSNSSTRKTDLAAIKAEREQHAAIIGEFETRASELRQRVSDLEREAADLAQRLRMRERDVAARTAELSKLREAMKADLPAGEDVAGNTLTGDYDEDTGRLIAAFAIERKRALFLDEQARNLIERLESSNRRSVRAEAIEKMREALDGRSGQPDAATAKELIAAEATIASAETRLNAILAETDSAGQQLNGHSDGLLAEKLGLEEQLGTLHARIDNVETAAIADWGTERADKGELRRWLGDIASDVSRLVYAAESGADAVAGEESLFERVQRFADDGVEVTALPNGSSATRPAKSSKSGKLSDRMAALTEIIGS